MYLRKHGEGHSKIKRKRVKRTKRKRNEGTRKKIVTRNRKNYTRNRKKVGGSTIAPLENAIPGGFSISKATPALEEFLKKVHTNAALKPETKKKYNSEFEHYLRRRGGLPQGQHTTISDLMNTITQGGGPEGDSVLSQEFIDNIKIYYNKMMQVAPR